MSSTFTGAWRRSATGTRLGGAGGGFGRGPADPVDATHLDPPEAPGDDPNFYAPSMMPAVPGDVPDTMVDQPWVGPRVPDAPIDHSAGAGHDQGIELGYGSGEPRASIVAARARAQDSGGVRARAWRAPTMDDATGQTERRQVLPINMGSTAQLRLQATSRPENTVDSTNGHEVNRWVWRKFGFRWRRPDMMPTRPGTADVVTPAPPVHDGNQYTSPFGRLALGRSRQQMTPMLRRIPRPWDEELVVDGTDAPQPVAQYQSWGL